jgi:hypothetical protein
MDIAFPGEPDAFAEINKSVVNLNDSGFVRGSDEEDQARVNRPVSGVRVPEQGTDAHGFLPNQV